LDFRLRGLESAGFLGRLAPRDLELSRSVDNPLWGRLLVFPLSTHGASAWIDQICFDLS
jgi:hypothetical protein